jgi:hypothetical protein
MVFQPVPNAAQLIVGYVGSPGNFSNSMWFTKAGFNVADMGLLGAAVASAITAEWLAFLANDFSPNVITIYDMRADGAPIVSYDPAIAAGGDADEIHPLNEALVLTLRTATRGRSGRGRMYLGGLSVGQSADGEWSAGTMAAALDLAAAIDANATAQGWQWVIASRVHDGALRDPALTFPITEWLVRSAKVGSQRRRVRRP